MNLLGRKAVLRVDAKVFEGLDLDFEVERHDGSDTNKATIRVANLSETSRGYIESKGRQVTLSAGYSQPGIIFKGQVSRSFNERQGADVVTVVECADGGQALRLGTVDLSLKAGATDKQVIDKCLDVLRGLGIGRGFVASFSPRAYTQAFSYSGPVKRLLDDLCQRQGLAWGIENGVVEIVKKGALREGGVRATELSAKTGLIGFPSSKDNLLMARSLINPNLQPRRAVKLVSSQTRLNGLYTIRKAKFTGNTRTGDWVVDIEAARDTSLRET